MSCFCVEERTNFGLHVLLNILVVIFKKYESIPYITFSVYPLVAMLTIAFNNLGFNESGNVILER